MWPASSPSDIDFSCGFHAKLRVRDALQEAAGRRHLVIELRQQRVDYGHV